MKLYDRNEFIKLPSGTIYSKVDIDSSELLIGLFSKISGSDYENDWIEQDLLGECGFPLSPINKDGSDNVDYVLNLRNNYKEFKTDLACSGRDGMYEDSDKFIVWSDSDVKKLATYLLNSIK